MAVTLKGQTAVYEGTSTDTKPIDADNNAIFKELDTGISYYYDGTDWNEIPSSGGGGGFTPTETQLAAMNSGIDSTKVAQIETNKNNISNVQTSLAVGSSDNGKVLTASYSGGTGSYAWVTPSGGGAAVNNATITIQKNGTTVDSFTSNQATDKTINITVPTSAADVSALPDTTKYAAALSLTIDSSTFVVTGQLKDQNGDNLGTAQTIDLPLESVVVGGSYNSQTQKVVLTLQNGNTVEFSIADLVSGLQTELSASNKLNPAYINYDSTHRAVSDTEKTTWDSKQNALSSTQLSAVNSGITSADVEQITTNKNNILSLTPTTSTIEYTATAAETWEKTSLSIPVEAKKAVYFTGNIMYSNAEPLGVGIGRGNTFSGTSIMAITEESAGALRGALSCTGIYYNNSSSSQTLDLWVKYKTAQKNMITLMYQKL